MERISKKIKDILNSQILEELNSSRLYLSMSEWAKFNGYFGIGKLYHKYHHEEYDHMEKIYYYLQDRDCLPETGIAKAQPCSFSDVKCVVDETVKHEIFITKKWHDIAFAALDEKDLNTYQLASEFIKEQTEEESKVFDLQNKLEVTGVDKIGLQLFDKYCDKLAG